METPDMATKVKVERAQDGYSAICPRCCKRHGKAEYGPRYLASTLCKDCAEKERKYRNEEARMRAYYKSRGDK
jgi:hypothetical protein